MWRSIIINRVKGVFLCEKHGISELVSEASPWPRRNLISASFPQATGHSGFGAS